MFPFRPNRHEIVSTPSRRSPRRRLGHLERLEDRRMLATFMVTTNADSGPGSLRQAILDSNDNTGPDRIEFQISGSSALDRTIEPITPLPNITEATDVDATTQPGYAGSPQVVLDGSLLPDGNANGLTLLGGSSSVKGLVISHFPSSGIYITGRQGNNVIEGNYLGTDLTGQFSRPNRRLGISIFNSSDNRLGGTGEHSFNLISGNTLEGIEIVGSSNGNIIQGNFIGTNRTGDDALPNLSGILISQGAHGTIIGTNGDGVDDELERNVISGNRGAGIRVVEANGTVVAGNWIGLTAAGDSALANSQGINIYAGDANVIGTNGDGIADAGERNVISGNDGSGIFIEDALSNTVAGNYIGLGVDGKTAVPNRSGVHIGYRSRGNIIGTDGDGLADLAERNYISGNTRHGVETMQAESHNVVAGNFIGVDTTGQNAAGNGGNGVHLDASDSIVVGGPDGQGNLISGNAGWGIKLYQTEDSLISGNRIGLAADGQTALGNAGGGIELDRASENRIGDGTAGGANEIAHNGERGISSSSQGSFYNTISHNSIYGHSAAGIDLGGDGATPNDPAESDGFQNTPTLAYLIAKGEESQLGGSLESTPDREFRLEFFLANSTQGPLEGKTFVDATMVRTDASGKAYWVIDIPTPPGGPVTATATEFLHGSARRTSEFSPAVVAASQLVITMDELSLKEGQGTVMATISRGDLPDAGSLTVELSNSHPQQISIPDQVLIPDGEHSASFEVQLVEDDVPEAVTSVLLFATVPSTAAGSLELRIRDNDLPAWHNAASTMDVNGDSFVSPLDALLVINFLNQVGTADLSSQTQADTPIYIDTNDDQFVSPIDALRVINYLNQSRPAEGEPAVAEAAADAFFLSASYDSLELPFHDFRHKRRLR